jgi:hypothetical protein
VIVGGIDHDAARQVRKQAPRKIGDGLRRDRENHQLSDVSGTDDRNGPRAELGRERGQALRPSRVRDRDLMSEQGEAAPNRSSDFSSADDSDAHVRLSFVALHRRAR